MFDCLSLIIIFVGMFEHVFCFCSNVRLVFLWVLLCLCVFDCMWCCVLFRVHSFVMFVVLCVCVCVVCYVLFVWAICVVDCVFMRIYFVIVCMIV